MHSPMPVYQSVFPELPEQRYSELLPHAYLLVCIIDFSQEDAANFMEKVKNACSKYLIRTPAANQGIIPQAPATLGQRPEIPIIGAGSTIIDTTATTVVAPATTEEEKPAVPKPKARTPRGPVILTPGQSQPVSASNLIL